MALLFLKLYQHIRRKPICDQSPDITNDICDALRRVRDSEVVAAVSYENII